MAAEGEFSFAWATVKMIAILALLLGVLVGALHVIKRLGPKTGLALPLSPGMSLVGRLPLGPKKFLALVQVGGDLLLLGVTDQNISLIKQVEDPELLHRLSAPSEAETGFAGLLRKLGGGGRD